MKNEFTVSEVLHNTFAIEQKTSFSQAVLYLVIGKEKAALIDTGVKSDNSLRDVVSKITDKPVIVLHTHAHFDHIGNSSRFSDVRLHEKEALVAKAHSDKNYLFQLCKTDINALFLFLVKKRAEKMFTFDFPKNYMAFSDGDTIDLGGRTLEIIHTPGHTPGSCCFLDRTNKLLFSGDTCCNWGVLLHIEFCESVQVFLQSMNKLCDLEASRAFTVNLPGHHAYPAQEGLPQKYKKCAESILDKTASFRPQKKHIIAKYEDILIALPRSYK